MSLVFGVAMLMSVPSRAGRAEPKPPKTIVLVHGAFADGSSWDKVFPLLAAKGYNVVAVHEPFTSFADDVAATRRAIELQPGEVILVGHSYGGAVITEAGNSEKVIRLVYVAAFAPDAGESINDLGKGQPAPRWLSALKIDSGGFAWLPPEIIATEFAQDLPPTEVRLLASKQGPILTRNFDAKITNAAWKAKPTSYLQTTEDHMIAPRAQAFMAKRMNATVTSVSASHVAMLSKPKDVAAAILQAAAAAPVTANK
jgi:pimeloyl-ACP methyl ester carboxylesterase